MCGRYAFFSPAEAVRRTFMPDDVPELARLASPTEHVDPQNRPLAEQGGFLTGVRSRVVGIPDGPDGHTEQEQPCPQIMSHRTNSV